MSPRPATLVLSGGGAKGAFQVGAEEVLRREAGFTWDRIFGVSVGALNGALLAQLEYDRLQQVWQTIREQDVYDKAGTLRLVWRLLILGKRGLYDNSALRKTIEKHAGGRPFKVPLHVGRVSLTSGAYELVDSDQPDILDAIWQSATMPVIWEPIGAKALVDGGLRNVTPLGDALDYHPSELVVLICSPDAIEAVAPPRDIVDAAKRSLTDITINEIMINDVREFVRLNALVKQAQAAGLELKTEKGQPLRYCPIAVIQPHTPMGDTLDFSREAIARRLAAGREAASEWLSTRK